ncbi:putative secreted hydrolase [Hypnocyclicus thermotrophus]|uniref:Secreted hydrolase n=1 Tax=Hypnocyclicus thermotrophus TaxID=1627895 RepID=A0AA46E0K7_9FUSO|nr:lipocalin family protein [Hypnocyclicus thermotrophus]TDT72560.1 putative secreted hydrolase [Hypnocyclicus thermotrophus]
MNLKKYLAYLYQKLFYVKNVHHPLSVFKNRKKRVITLPKFDSFQRDQDVQWWYWTGHLKGVNRKSKEEREFGFEIVFFAFNSFIFFKNELAQAAITDIKDKNFSYYEDVKFLSLPKKLKNGYKFDFKNKKNWSKCSGGNGEDKLNFKIDNYLVKLKLKLKEKPVIRYNGKAYEYTFGGYTYYYSREKMETSGIMEIDNEIYDIYGITWFDRQLGELYQAIFKGWQWFALSLKNGNTIMLFDFFKENKNNYGSITKNNKTIELFKEDFNVKVINEWISKKTKIKYPSGWHIKLKNMDYYVYPKIKNQELACKHKFWIGPEYWEGDCIIKNIKDEFIGEAYVELNGFGHKLITIDIDNDGKRSFGF